MSDEIASLVEHIHRSPEPLHADFTAEVRALVRLGLPAARAVLPLLMSPDELARLRAQRVLEGVSRHVLADTWGGDWALLWHDNGDYHWRDAAEKRQAAVDRWLAWLDQAVARASD
ncbi:hypothetical protein E4Q23_17680 [Candidatus Accumulibacter phosphatis]|uniref:Uncharacterized protein n=1 Tax=Candidatus Accumulibacter phosphatis TaxID=327160 RepID=A0ABX1U3J1_9PROT|nr:hypothetical protein [Candidatus Accumulibacter phosphatis]NMQ29433.1 hypothetical protein [Candidatus Accumulibacter phosphatis]